MFTLAEIQLDPRGAVGWLVVGLFAGWLAGAVMKGGGYGLFGDLITGLVGAVIGGLVFGIFVPGTIGLIGSIIVAFVGACILISVLRACGSKRTFV